MMYGVGIVFAVQPLSLLSGSPPKMSPAPRSAVALALALAFSQTASAGLFGPSTELIQGEALTQKLQSAPLVVSVNGSALDIRSKAAAVGGFLLGFIASSAMASGPTRPGMNAQQMNQSMQANMQIASSFNQNVQSAIINMAAVQAAKPKAQIAKEGPVVPVSQQLLASLAQTPQLHVATASDGTPAAPADLQLRISQPVWQLDFSMVSSDYTLRYQVDVSLYQKQSDTIFFKDGCQGEYAEKMPREAWEANDFGALEAASMNIAKQCALGLLSKLGLQPVTLAVDTSAAEPVAGLASGASSSPENAVKDDTRGGAAQEKESVAN